jgi:putative transposase
MNALDEFLADALEFKRALAVKMDLKGYSHHLIEDLLQVSAPFIRKWRVQYRNNGVESLSLQYKGSQGFLSPEQRAEVIAFLRTKDHYRIDALRDYVEDHYGVVYKSKQSYYDLLHEAHIGWKKTSHEHPDKDAKKIAARRQALRRLLASRKAEIESGQLVVFLEDECHLLWGDTLGYIWGRRNMPITVPIKNIKERQTYYGALNFKTQTFHVCPFEKGDSVHTVKFVKYLQGLHPEAQLLFIWDGASYHRYAEMQAFLTEVNKGLPKRKWKVRCELFAPNAPEQNPVEDIWLQGKNFLRKFFYKHKTFSQVKAAFLQFLQTTKFDFPKLALYAYD